MRGSLLEPRNAVHGQSGRSTCAIRTRPVAHSAALISTAHCQLFLQELRAREVNASLALAAAQFAADGIALDAFMTEASFLAFLRAAEALTGDPDLGLHTGQRIELQALDLFGMLLRSTKNALETYQSFIRYSDVWRGSQDYDVLATSTHVRVRHRALRTCPVAPRLLADMVLSRTMKCARLVTHHVAPAQVLFAYPRPAKLDLHRSIFPNASLEFDASENAIVFGGAERFGDPSPHHDPELQSVLEPHVARAAASATPPPTDTVGVVRSMLAKQLATDALSMQHVAHALQCSERGLRRQLRQLGTSYQELLAEVRTQKALAHRERHPHDSGVELSAQLGFSEPAVFYRAFKRWTGTSWSDKAQSRGREARLR
jgi:AraC-like DNA-binding protein